MSSRFEVWNPVRSVPELEASSLGRVRRKPYERDMPNGGIRTYTFRPTYGYRVPVSGLAGFRMTLQIKGMNKTFKIARLVCDAFHGLPPEGRNVCMHIDDDPGNNRPENLRWGTQKENMNSEQFLSYCRTRRSAAGPSRMTNHAR